MSTTCFFQTDCTYKLTWNDYDVLIAGTSDANHRFFPIALFLISDSESAVTYHQMFQSLDSASTRVNQIQFCPSYVLADGCPGISKAVAERFPHARRLMCWFHVTKAMKENRGKGFPQVEWKKLEADINALQGSPTEVLFRFSSISPIWKFAMSSAAPRNTWLREFHSPS
jgi:hypothetical protein